MATNYTTNYQLNQWEPTDQVLRTDFNADNAKLDAALADLAENKADQADLDALSSTVTGLASTVAGHAGTLSSLQNGRVYLTSYQGTGTYGIGGPVTISLPGEPEVMLVTGGGHLLTYVKGRGTALVWYSGSGTGNVTVSWNGSQISWYGTGRTQQLNDQGQTFYVVAFYCL